MLLNFTDLELGASGKLYLTLYEEIKKAVQNSVIKKGEKLPSIREASRQLSVSRTTVENAYARLCIEGIAESQPQRGYFIVGVSDKRVDQVREVTCEESILYDFSSRKVDIKASDTDLWKKTVRRVLWDSGELTSYGHHRGEVGLRQALADYAYKARGVIAKPENIVIGAGIGPLINILCGLIGRRVCVAFENGGFFEAEHIFGDYGINIKLINSDKSGATIEALQQSDANILFLLPSLLSKLSVTSLAKRRNGFCEWVSNSDDRLIIEDDYNGELRYTARSVPAFQGKIPEKTVYIGSFSKLLLPSVRIAYMVLPDALSKRFDELGGYYNQTCGKIEQMALREYIASGALEKHLRRLRRLYYNKSRILCRELEQNLKSYKDAVLYESSLTLELKTTIKAESCEICKKALESGIRVMPSGEIGTIRLCFAGIDEKKIPSAVKYLDEILENYKKGKKSATKNIKIC